MFSKLRTKSEQRSSKQTRKSRMSCDSGGGIDGSSSESEKHRRRRTQQCYRCHQVGHIARNCPSTAPVESAAPTETVPAMTTRSIEDYWMTTTGREAPSKESWYLDCATTSHICGDRKRFERYTEYTKRDGQEIHDVAGRVAGKAIGVAEIPDQEIAHGSFHRKLRKWRFHFEELRKGVAAAR